MITHRIFILIGTLLMAATARADKRDPVVAEQLFNEGRTALERRDYVVACKKFAESHRLDPAAGTVMNRASCEQSRGRVATAWQLWREALDRLEPNDDRVAFVRSQIRTLEPRIPRLTLKPGTPLSTRTSVYRDGVRLGESSLDVPLRVDPGSHVIVVRAPDHADQLYRVELSERERRTLLVGVGRQLPRAESVSKHGSGTLTWGYVLAGVGLASVGGAIVTHALMEQKKDTIAANCVNKVCNEQGYSAVQDGKALLVANRVLWGLGGTAFAGGVALLLFSTSAADDEQQVGLVLSPNALGLVHRGRF